MPEVTVWSEPAVLEVDQVSFSYESANPVVRAVCAEFAPGEVVVLVGPNGSGKSTLLRLMLGTLRPDSGHVHLGHDGQRQTSVHEMTPAVRASQIAFLPQRPMVSAAFSVRQVVTLGQHALLHDDRAVDAALATVELSSRRDSMFSHLSVGQQQRASLARVLAQVGAMRSSPVILADEPCSALDPVHRLRTWEILREHARLGAVVVVSEHDLNMALRFADRVMVLSQDGSVAAWGTPAEALGAEVLRSVFEVEAESLAGTDGTRVLMMHDARSTEPIR